MFQPDARGVSVWIRILSRVAVTAEVWRQPAGMRENVSPKQIQTLYAVDVHEVVAVLFAEHKHAAFAVCLFCNQSSRAAVCNESVKLERNVMAKVKFLSFSLHGVLIFLNPSQHGMHMHMLYVCGVPPHE